MKPWIVILLIVVLIVIWFILTYNSFVKLDNMSDEAFSTMDVYLKKRYDLIPNTVETVKGYATHEKDTLENVVQARYKAMNASTNSSRLEAEGELSNALNRLLSITEAYPDLKANTNFQDLQKQLNNMENEIASTRKYYNGVCNKFNIKTQTIPSNIVASICNFTKKPLFEVSALEERENVKVKF